MSDYGRAFVEGMPPTSGPIRFVAGTEGLKIDGRDYRMDGMDLARYQANPVVMWCHDLKTPPIGRGVPAIDGGRLLLDVEFDLADSFAADIDGKYRRGFLNAVSMTALPTDGAGGLGPRRGVVEHSELIEVSAVPVPLDPDALKVPSLRAMHRLGVEMRDLVAAGGRDLSANDKRERLNTALTDRFAGPDTYVWIRDFGDDWVVYELEGPDGCVNYRLGYTVDKADNVTLDPGTPEPVEVRTTYEPASSDIPALRSLRDALAQDRAARELQALRSALDASSIPSVSRIRRAVRAAIADPAVIADLERRVKRPHVSRSGQ